MIRNSVGTLFGEIALICLIGIGFCLLVSCGKGGNHSGHDLTSQINAEIDKSDLIKTLQRELSRQLELRGGKFVSSAPVGDSGRVTDLAYDTDTHTLSWTYANLADYDGNGEVGVPDITPIANNFLANTTDGSGNDALESWIDGDKNGEVGVPDVTPIANNYLARIDGYRVYRKAPGETEFTLLPNPDDAGSPLTIPHEDVFPAGSPDTLIPVQYTFEDEVQGDTGIVSYYVAGYDTKDEEESEPSNMVNIDLSTGQVNAAPVAKLAVDTDYGGAPLTVTFDASGSVDSDGTITEYRFDFDGDGTIDYSSDDAEPPAESSGGTVTDITPGASPWLVTVTYTQFSSEFYPVSVIVVDNEDAESLPILKDIGVTGWEREVIKSSTGNEFNFGVSDIALDPQNGEIVVAGYLLLSQWDIGTPGVYFARRHGPGDWSVELVFEYESNSLWNPDGEYLYGEVLYCDIAWNEHNNPVLLLGAQKDYITGGVLREFAVCRLTSGEWQFEELPEVPGADGPFTWGKADEFLQFEPGRFVAKCYSKIGNEGENDYLLWYDDGVWSIEYMTRDSTATNNYGYFNGLTVAPDQSIYTSTGFNQDYENMFLLMRESPGIWSKEYFGGYTEDSLLSFVMNDITINDEGQIAIDYFYWTGPSLENRQTYRGIAIVGSGELRMFPYPVEYNSDYVVVKGLSQFRGGYSAFVDNLKEEYPRSERFFVCENEKMFYETPGYPYDTEMTYGCYVNCSLVLPDGHAYVYLISSGDFEAYAYRVDPLVEEE